MHSKSHALHARTNLVARPNEAGASQYLNWQCRVYERSSPTEAGHGLDYGQLDASAAQCRHEPSTGDAQRVRPDLMLALACRLLTERSGIW